jgi:hypothetical protein
MHQSEEKQRETNFNPFGTTVSDKDGEININLPSSAVLQGHYDHFNI